MKNILLFGGSKGIGKACINKYKTSNKIISIQRSRLINKKNITYIEFDLKNTQKINELIKQIKQKFKTVDYIIFNASHYDLTNIVDINYEKIIDVFNTNLFSYMLVLKDLGSVLNKDSSIVFISSTAPRSNPFGSSLYAPTQAALECFAKVAAKELAPKTRVNIIAPGPINTSLLHENLKAQGIKKNVIINSILLKRLGEPEDIVDLIDFLLSIKSKHITGQIISINGGNYI